jgi:hypothetical protein
MADWRTNIKTGDLLRIKVDWYKGTELLPAEVLYTENALIKIKYQQISYRTGEPVVVQLSNGKQRRQFRRDVINRFSRNLFPESPFELP